MDVVGSTVLLLALMAAGYGFFVGILAIAARRPAVGESAYRAGMAVFPLVTLGTASLLWLIFTNTFSIAYVAEHSARELSPVYKLAVLWAGQRGSLLFWSWLLSIFLFVALVANRRKHRELMPLVATILCGVQFFFLLLNTVVASPFSLLGVTTASGATQIVTPPNGTGLNPLLQYFEMVLHPPLLYLGYTGFSVPFAFALAALIKRYPAERWVPLVRRWSLWAWTFLGIGILLGAHWAYAVLGWGGYWGWDPVENASLMPWITATAFLHAAVVQQKRGMLRVWSASLLLLTFVLSVFGTFLTRSGIVNSVHAFAQSPVGPWLGGFFAVLTVVTIWGLARGWRTLEGENRLGEIMSRESAVLFGILLLLASFVAVFAGTMFPVFSQWMAGAKITVGPPFFDRMNVPIALLLLVLMGLGPLLAWKRTQTAVFLRKAAWPAAAGIGAGVAAGILGAGSMKAILAIALGAFVVVVIALEFARAARSVSAHSGVNFVSAIGQVAMQDTRRYGGYIAHLGLVLIFFGIAGQAMNRNVKKMMTVGSSMRLGSYTLVAQDFDQTQGPNYQGERASIEVLDRGRSTMMLFPEIRYYPETRMTATRVAIYSSLARDLYVVYAGNDERTGAPEIHAFMNPLVHWIWLGGLVLVLGTLLAMIPSARPVMTASARVPVSVAETAAAPAPMKPDLVTRGHR